MRFSSLLTAMLLFSLSNATRAEDQTFDFVAIGDSGYEGSWYDFVGGWPGVRSQSWAPGYTGLPTMSALLRDYCEEHPCNFGVMLGDNIYPDGVAGTDPEDDQARFDAVFVEPFTPLLTNDPNFRIYPTLGNHDWYQGRKGALAQVEFLKNTPPFAMGGLFYNVKPKAGKGLVELFIVDTEIILSQHKVYKDRLTDEGAEAREGGVFDDPITYTHPLTDAEKNQLTWLQHALDASTAKWKIIVAHHPLWSSGSTKFEEAHVLRRELLPVICGRADAYFAGHEHSNEVHSDSCETVLPEGEAKPLLHVVAGAFSKSRMVHAGFKAYQDRTYPQLNSQFTSGKQPENGEFPFKQTWGFSHVSITGDKATVRMITHIEDQPIPEVIEPTFSCVFTKDKGFPVEGCQSGNK